MKSKIEQQQVVHRFRNPSRRELIAMWIWSSEYARSGLGAVEFYERLNDARKRQIEACIKQFEEASP